MKVQVRVLHGEVDANAAQRIANETGAAGTRDPSKDLRIATAELEAPMQVTWRDETLELEAVAEQLRLGAVRVTDLVNDGSGWKCISDFPPLSDACALAPKHLLPSPEERKAMLWPVVRLALIAIGIGVVIYVVMQTHR